MLKGLNSIWVSQCLKRKKMSNVQGGMSNVQGGMSNVQQGMSNVQQGMSNVQGGTTLEVFSKPQELAALGHWTFLVGNWTFFSISTLTTSLRPSKSLFPHVGWSFDLLAWYSAPAVVFFHTLCIELVWCQYPCLSGNWLLLWPARC